MSKTYKLSQLLMNNEKSYYKEDEELKEYKKVRKVNIGNLERYLTWVDDKNMKSITTPDGRELTPEELFDFVIGNNITDLARTQNKSDNIADIAIVLGNGELKTTRERAIKAFELYKLGIVKKIIFTGGIPKARDIKGVYHPESKEEYMNNEKTDNLEWQDLPEADWGAETYIPDVFNENYQEHSTIITEEFLKEIGINPEDVLIEAMSTSTQENAEFCKNIFDSEEVENGTKIRNAILITTCTHGSRASRQFKKVFGDKINFKWCPSTLDLEKYPKLKAILKASNFDEIAFRQELKNIYCTVPELIKMLQQETANHRNAFILGDIDEPDITTNDIENTYSNDNENESLEH